MTFSYFRATVLAILMATALGSFSTEPVMAQPINTTPEVFVPTAADCTVPVPTLPEFQQRLRDAGLPETGTPADYRPVPGELSEPLAPISRGGEPAFPAGTFPGDAADIFGILGAIRLTLACAGVDILGADVNWSFAGWAEAGLSVEYVTQAVEAFRAAPYRQSLCLWGYTGFRVLDDGRFGVLTIQGTVGEDTALDRLESWTLSRDGDRWLIDDGIEFAFVSDPL